MMGKGHLMMSQVLWTQQGVFSSWMSHSDEIKSADHSPSLDGPSDKLTSKFKEVFRTFCGENPISHHVYCLLLCWVEQ